MCSKTYRNNTRAVDHILQRLNGIPPPDADLGLTLSLLRVEYLLRRGDLNEALTLVETLSESLKTGTTDISARVKLMVFKARILDACKQPQKGFSLAMRASSIAYKARLLPALWEAIGVLANVLISLSEFDAAIKILESIMPQIMETDDCELAARSYSFFVDAHMGLAGQAEPKSPKRKEHMNKALEFIDSAFGEFSRIEDVRGQCEMMAKKATIMHLVGDVVLANDYAAKYLDIKRQAAAEA